MKQVIDGIAYDSLEGNTVCNGSMGGITYSGYHTDRLVKMINGEFIVDYYHGRIGTGGRAIKKVSFYEARRFTEAYAKPEVMAKFFPSDV
jgi:ribonucleotide reductase alpha subunit